MVVLRYLFFMKYPKPLEKVIRLFSQFPGVGKRTGARYAFDFLLEWDQSKVEEFLSALRDVREELSFCAECGALQDGGGCVFCHNPSRRKDLLCLVANAKDIFSIEATGEFHGVYQVLGSLLSPLDSFFFDKTEHMNHFACVKKRLEEGSVKEVIIALDSTLEGDATALYLKEMLQEHQVSCSRIAFGIPVGSVLEYVDGGTLARAFSGRVGF